MDHLAFFHDLSGHLGGAMHGGNERWLAPVAFFNAADGFGEPVWSPAAPVTFLALRFAGTTVRRCWGRTSGSSGPGREIALISRGAPNQYDCKGPIRFGQVFLPDSSLDRASTALGQASLSGRLRDDLVFTADPMLHQHTADYVRRATDARHRPTSLEMEARALLLVERLAQLHGPPKNPQAFARGGLSPTHLRLACQYLMDRLADDVALVELAALVKLSPFHLCRAFRQSTGLPPHRWQLSRRIERAREALANTDASITEIAAAVGYADPGQFATAFRKVVGLSPTQFRRESKA